ncbi:MAG TPA: hypothetical protein VF601_20385 [Beijerinckiaceae bacterium]|jgi:hypothetical protein
MRIAVLAALVLATLAGPAAAAGDPVPAPARSSDAAVERQHPAEHFRRAAALFRAGDRDRAVFWFYLGQLRYRVHLAARQGQLDPSGDPALFSSLMQAVGGPINRYAFGDVPALARTIDEVLAWDDAHPDGFTPKDRFAAERADIRKGLTAMRDEALATREEIRASRIRNGLQNR